MVHSVEWTTSSQEIVENGPESRKSSEPVAHFKEWTTGSQEISETKPKPRKSPEPVVHFGEWTTSSSEKAENGPKSRKSSTPVAHSVEWTTSSPATRPKQATIQKSPSSQPRKTAPIPRYIRPRQENEQKIKKL